MADTGEDDGTRTGNRVDIDGDATGPVIAGNYNVVVDAQHGSTVTVLMDGQRPRPRRRDRIRLLPRRQGTPLGRDADLQRACELVQGIASHLVQGTAGKPTADKHLILRTHGAGDGGLFTGILARYLAIAARSNAMPDAERALAARMVAGTAQAFWNGRAIENHRSWEVLVFSPNPAVPAAGKREPGTAVELSTQLQAWMTLEAAATLAG